MVAKRSKPTPDTLSLMYIIGTYPLLTTTFIDREVKRLRQLGVTLQVVSIRHPQRLLSPEQEALQAEVEYLLPVSIVKLLAAHFQFFVRQPLAYGRTLFYLMSRPHPNFKARFKTILHFGLGVLAAHVIRPYSPTQLHTHFVDRAATVALVAGRLLGLPYSATAHANDIFVNPVLLPEKMAEAQFIATCTGYNADHLARVHGPDLSSKLRCIYHGLDLDQYEPQQPKANSQPILLSVGQLKEKKGFIYLLRACRLLRNQGYEFSCRIVGAGPLQEELKSSIQQLGLDDTVMLLGALPHEKVIEQYRQAVLFTLPCILGKDGDRDGIPNVILEAMAMGLPVVSTDHSSIPEVVTTGVNGILVPPTDAVALAAALALLLDNPECARRYGRNGQQMVRETFSVQQNVERLLGEFIAVAKGDKLSYEQIGR